MYFVYMLRCRGGSLYTGIAADMEKRLRQHASGGAACAKYTRAHPPEALAAIRRRITQPLHGWKRSSRRSRPQKSGCWPQEKQRRRRCSRKG